MKHSRKACILRRIRVIFLWDNTDRLDLNSILFSVAKTSVDLKNDTYGSYPQAGHVEMIH